MRASCLCEFVCKCVRVCIPVCVSVCACVPLCAWCPQGLIVARRLWVYVSDCAMIINQFFLPALSFLLLCAAHFFAAISLAKCMSFVMCRRIKEGARPRCSLCHLLPLPCHLSPTQSAQICFAFCQPMTDLLNICIYVCMYMCCNYS